MIYFDHAATTPICEEAKNAMIDYMDYYGNPSSLYKIGAENKNIIEQCRGVVAEAIGANPHEIYFTSGGTESNNCILNSVGDNVLASSFEHPSVLNARKLDTINPDSQGYINPKNIKEALNIKTYDLVSVMTVNNELGTVQYLEDISKIVHKKGSVFHTDAVQAVGHILELKVNKLGIDYLSASAHKFYGPKGVGFMYVKDGLPIKPLLNGGGQENGVRSGTENVMGIIGMTAALIHSYNDVDINKIKRVSNYLKQHLLAIDDVLINGGDSNKLYSHINVYIKDVKNEALVNLLAESDICVSAGSACSSGENKPSHVLKALGYSDNRARNSIRISLGESNTIEEAQQFLDVLKYYISILRGRA